MHPVTCQLYGIVSTDDEHKVKFGSLNEKDEVRSLVGQGHIRVQMPAGWLG